MGLLSWIRGKATPPLDAIISVKARATAMSLAVTLAQKITGSKTFPEPDLNRFFFMTKIDELERFFTGLTANLQAFKQQLSELDGKRVNHVDGTAFLAKLDVLIKSSQSILEQVQVAKKQGAGTISLNPRDYKVSLYPKADDCLDDLRKIVGEEKFAREVGKILAA